MKKQNEIIQKVENWNGFDIRFISTDGNEWVAIAKDVADALGYDTTYHMTRNVKLKYLGKQNVDMSGSAQKVGRGKIREVTTITTKGIIKATMHSHKKEAEEFQDWVLDVIDELREQTGLEQYEMFKMFDKNYQKQVMSNLKQNTPGIKQYDYINANRTTNRVVSDMYGHTKGKALSKSEMSPEMLATREKVLNDSASLYSTKRNFNLDISVRDSLNEKYNKKEEA